jgi:hypothetical protein
VIGYKAEMINEPILRVLTVIGLVLFGSSVVAFVLAPALNAMVNAALRGGRRNGGGTGEIIVLLLLGGGVFWAYYLLCLHGAAALLPAAWRN